MLNMLLLTYTNEDGVSKGQSTRLWVQGDSTGDELSIGIASTQISSLDDSLAGDCIQATIPSS